MSNTVEDLIIGGEIEGAIHIDGVTLPYGRLCRDIDTKFLEACYLLGDVKCAFLCNNYLPWEGNGYGKLVPVPVTNGSYLQENGNRCTLSSVSSVGEPLFFFRTKEAMVNAVTDPRNEAGVRYFGQFKDNVAVFVASDITCNEYFFLWYDPHPGKSAIAKFIWGGDLSSGEAAFVAIRHLMKYTAYLEDPVKYAFRELPFLSIANCKGFEEQ